MNQKEQLQPQSKCVHSSGVFGKPFTEGLNLLTMDEIWKDVPGFEGVYQISSVGRLKSFRKDPAGYVLSNVNKKGGYFSVVLSHKGKIMYVRIHNLMALSFWGIKTNRRLHCHHKDGNKQHNWLSNLEILDSGTHHAVTITENPNCLKGMIHYNKYIKTYPIYQYDLKGNYIAEFRNSIEAQAKTGVCYRNILQVANNTEYKPGKTRKQAGGFVWKLKKESNVAKNTRECIQRELVFI